MGNNFELDAALEELISSLQFSGWNTKILSNNKQDYVVAENQTSKIVVMILSDMDETSIINFKNFAASIKATPYFRQFSKNGSQAQPLLKQLA